MIDQITNELILASVIKKTNKVSTIAGEIGYKPMLIINALYRGQETGKLKYSQKKDIFTIHDDVELEHLTTTEGINEVREQLELFARYMAETEQDVSVEELQMKFLPGTPELHIRIAVYSSKVLTSYEVADPKDRESVYTFVTLKENADKQWGMKQFVAKKKDKKKR